MLPWFVTRDPRISCHSVACQAREEQEEARDAHSPLGGNSASSFPEDRWTLQATAATALIFLTINLTKANIQETGCCGEQTRKSLDPLHFQIHEQQHHPEPEGEKSAYKIMKDGKILSMEKNERMSMCTYFQTKDKWSNQLFRRIFLEKGLFLNIL